MAAPSRAEKARRERASHDAGDETAARDCRAQAERLTRLLVKLRALPGDNQMSLPISLCRIGDALWLFVEAEYYNIFQRDLRARHPGTPIVVATLTNGWRPGYLPPAELYGRGIYQEEVAVLAAGCLEAMLDEVDRAAATL